MTDIPETPNAPDVSHDAVASDGLTEKNPYNLRPLHPTLPHAVVFTKPAGEVCGSCNFVKNQLTRYGMPFITTDITPLAEALKNRGLLEAPFVVIHNIGGDAMGASVYISGKAPTQLMQLRNRLRIITDRDPDLITAAQHMLETVFLVTPGQADIPASFSDRDFPYKY